MQTTQLHHDDFLKVLWDESCSRRFYVEVLGGEPVLEPPSDPHSASSFLNVRVADIRTVYERWRARGAQFLTPPIDRGGEIRCYMRDRDGHLIEVGQLVGRV